MEAIADYDEALRLQPDYALAYYNRGYVNAILTRRKESFADLNTALEFAQAEGDSALAASVEELLQSLEGEARSEERQAGCWGGPGWSQPWPRGPQRQGTGEVSVGRLRGSGWRGFADDSPEAPAPEGCAGPQLAARSRRRALRPKASGNTGQTNDP